MPHPHPSLPASPTLAAIALGANLKHPTAQIRAALGALAGLPSTGVVSTSSIIITEAVTVGQVSPGGSYHNAAAIIATTLSATELLAHLQTIERILGRDRTTQPHGAPRTIDLDLVLYGNLILTTPALTVPHPSMHERTFVLIPLAEIAPEMLIPTVGRTIAAQLATLRSAQSGASR